MDVWRHLIAILCTKLVCFQIFFTQVFYCSLNFGAMAPSIVTNLIWKKDGWVLKNVSLLMLDKTWMWQCDRSLSIRKTKVTPSACSSFILNIIHVNCVCFVVSWRGFRNPWHDSSSFKCFPLVPLQYPLHLEDLWVYCQMHLSLGSNKILHRADPNHWWKLRSLSM